MSGGGQSSTGSPLLGERPSEDNLALETNGVEVPVVGSLGNAAAAVAHLNAAPDVDGAIRTEALAVNYYGEFYPSLAAMLVAKSLNFMMAELKKFSSIQIEKVLEEKGKVDALVQTIPEGHDSIITLLDMEQDALAQAGNDGRAPEVPQEISVGPTNKVHFHGFGVGFQVYTWDGSSWGAPVPDATLYDEDGNIVASHFAGPTWQSNSGSRVVGVVVPPRLTGARRRARRRSRRHRHRQVGPGGQPRARPRRRGD